MSTRITDLENVALYDSMSGYAFGPTFPSEKAAADFLEFTEDLTDPRTWADDEMEHQFELWIVERGAPFGLELGRRA